MHDALVDVLRGEDDPWQALKIDNPPAPILMVGLQGSGKTTTTGKLAKRLKEKEGKKVLMASLDVYRPAAMDQLAVLGTQVGVDTLPIVPGQKPVDIAKRAKQQATLGGYDVYMLDTAGRLHIDEVLMDEVEQVRNAVDPRETLLVVDGLTGQVAVEVAEEFDAKVGISGVVLTRMDGDGRGGAALSMRAVTGKPIRFVGLGEKMDALETFEPDRIAGRILGMGDIVALVEKAQETMEMEQTERMMKRMVKGQFNMNDLKMQLEQMIQMGGMQGMMGMMPGMGKMAKQMDQAGLGRQDSAPADRFDPIHDQTRARQPATAAGKPQETHCRGFGDGGQRPQQAAQDAPANVGHDEKDGQDGQRQDAETGHERHVRQRRPQRPRKWLQAWTPRHWNRRPKRWAARCPACRAWVAAWLCLRASAGLARRSNVAFAPCISLRVCAKPEVLQ